MEIGILRATCPEHFVTHNLMGFFPDLNYYDLAEELDFVSWDNYHFHGATPGIVAAAHDHMWGILRRNFWVMEQQVGKINWSVYNPEPGPGFTRIKSYQGIGHGADGIVYFRWRQAVGGSEQYHSGLLDAAGRKTMGYAEAKSIGAELKSLAPILAETAPAADVAILLDYDSRWTISAQPHNALLSDNPGPGTQFPASVFRVDGEERYGDDEYTGRRPGMWPYSGPYISLWERNVGAAIVSPDSDLSNYKVVCAPFLTIVRPAVAERLADYVKQGGTLILGPRTGFKDESSKLFTDPQPGPLSALAGATVKYFDSLEPERRNILRWDNVPHMHRTETGVWAEVLEPMAGTETIAWYNSGWYANEAAITHKQHEGGGQVIYVGCMGGPDLYANLWDWLLPQLDVQPLLSPVPGVEVCARSASDGRKVIFVLNHSSHPHPLTLAQPLTDLLTGETHQRSLVLKPRQVVIYEQPAKES